MGHMSNSVGRKVGSKMSCRQEGSDGLRTTDSRMETIALTTQDHADSSGGGAWRATEDWLAGSNRDGSGGEARVEGREATVARSPKMMEACKGYLMKRAEG